MAASKPFLKYFACSSVYSLAWRCVRCSTSSKSRSSNNHLLFSFIGFGLPADVAEHSVSEGDACASARFLSQPFPEDYGSIPFCAGCLLRLHRIFILSVRHVTFVAPYTAKSGSSSPSPKYPKYDFSFGIRHHHRAAI